MFLTKNTTFLLINQLIAPYFVKNAKIKATA